MDDDWDDDLDDDVDPAEEVIACPDCHAEVYAEADACQSCGYWITDADREAGWATGSASHRIRMIGWWLIGVALIGVLALWRF